MSIAIREIIITGELGRTRERERENISRSLMSIAIRENISCVPRRRFIEDSASSRHNRRVEVFGNIIAHHFVFVRTHSSAPHLIIIIIINYCHKIIQQTVLKIH